MANKIKILAVDDEKFNLTLLASCLKSENYEICACTNAIDALQEFKQQYFDVVILDVLMPGIDGFELRKLIREIDERKPIIFLTALVDDINTTMLKQISWDQYTYYMNKSFSKKVLIAKLEQAVAVHRNEQALADYYCKLESELALAGDMQKILLPDWCIHNEHMTVSSLYLPSTKVSGDIFEVFPIRGGKYLLFIGDIAGHGIQAALYMSAIQSLLKVVVSTTRDLAEIRPYKLLNQLNSFFCVELGGSNYMTCLVGIIDFESNHLLYQSAGHPGLIGCSVRDGRTWPVGDNQSGGIPIGWVPGFEYSEEGDVEFQFEDDTIFLGYTDGIIDVCTKTKEVMEESVFRELLGQLVSDTGVATIPFRLRQSMEQIGFDENPDDICLVAIQKYMPTPQRMVRFIPAQTRAVTAVAVDFSGRVLELTQDTALAFKVELLLYEFLNNVIIHGIDSRRRSKNGILVDMQICPDRVLITGLDRGKAWEFSSKRPEVESGSSDTPTLATSGRGLAIMREITSHISRNCYCGLNETVFTIQCETQTGQE